jgi:type I restriction enzyme S subunit
MTDQTTGNVPRIRFKAYSEPWAEEKIGDVLAEKRRPIVLEDDRRYELITVKRRNEGVVSRGHLLGREILVKNYAELKAGDFVISKRQVVHGATGIVPPALDAAIVSNEYLTAVDSERLITEFFAILASLPAMRRKFFLSSYGVDIEKLFFDADDWKKRTVMFPDVQEQSRVSQFFRKLNEMLDLHEHKHEKLAAIKTAMLQKMFPKPGAAAPEVRFRGFSEPWVEKKLRDVGTFNPKEVLPECFEYVDLESVVGTEMVGHRTEMRRTAPSRAQRLARKGDLFYQTVRPYQKNNHLFNLADDNYVFSTGYAQIRPHDDGSFLLSLMQRDDFVRVVLANCTGTSYPAITANALSEILVLTPSADEQKKIGAYFFSLDALIARHAAQVRNLKQIKLACLDEMFV